MVRTEVGRAERDRPLQVHSGSLVLGQAVVGVADRRPDRRLDQRLVPEPLVDPGRRPVEGSCTVRYGFGRKRRFGWRSLSAWPSRSV